MTITALSEIYERVQALEGACDTNRAEARTALHDSIDLLYANAKCFQQERDEWRQWALALAEVERVRTETH